jgi:outer membrane protein assembly factor BamD
MGVEIITPGVTVKPADNGGLKAVGPTDSTPLPAAEKPAAAPDAVNDVAAKPQPAAQAPNANGKNPKPEFDKGDESSSKHKKKKGLSKLNPF